MTWRVNLDEFLIVTAADTTASALNTRSLTSVFSVKEVKSKHGNYADIKFPEAAAEADEDAPSVDLKS